MLPVSSPSLFFAADQDWQFRVQLWDTPQTVLQDDTGSGGLRLDVRQPTTAAEWYAYAEAVKAVADDTDPNTAFQGTGSEAVVTDGRWPIVQAYWGAGTPGHWGVQSTGRVALKWSGTLVSSTRRAWFGNTTNVTFALAGSGWCRIDVINGGTRNTVFAGDLSEGQFLSEGFSYSDAADVTLPAGCTVEVFYVQDGTEPWGGLVVKAIHGTRPADSDLHAAAAAAPVLSCGLVSIDSVAPVMLPFIQDINIRHSKGGASTADITVPLINPYINDGHGWMYYRTADPADPGSLELWDAAALVTTVKRKRLIRIQVARRSTSPDWVSLFTGFINDFDPDSTGTLKLNCTSFEQRLVEQFEQAPDRISYMGRGFRTLDYLKEEVSRMSEPVYNVPAFDNWPLAWAVEELGVRCGIDPSVYREPLQAVASDGSGTAIDLPWGPAYRFRAETTSGARLRLPRPVHYGNVGLSFTESRPIDDEYVFRVEPTSDSWARTREMTDKLGYVCRYDTNGRAVLQPAYTPSFIVDLVPADVTSGTMTDVISPAAFGAGYLTATAASTVEKTVKGSRIDVAFPRIDDAFSWNYTITKVGEGSPAATGTINPATNSPDTLKLLYSGNVTAAGTSDTVYKLFQGDYAEYEVSLSPVIPGSPPPGAKAYVDAIIVYAQDPDVAILPELSTSDTALSVATVSQQDATRNRVTIVGRRKGTVTDSDKLTEAQAPTDQEFVVESAVDLASIVDPTAKNYVGYVKQAMIYDSSISDNGFARYLAQVFIYRQSVPQPGTSVSHTLLPMLEIDDPVAVSETRYETAVPGVRQYVQDIQHSLGKNRFSTTVTTEPWPEYPAYEPRTDIDLADFNNVPVINPSIDYVSLSGHDVNNPSVSLVHDVPEGVGAGRATKVYDNVAVAGTGTKYLSLSPSAPWPPVKGTFQIRPTTGGGGETYEDDRYLTHTAFVYGGLITASVSLFFAPSWSLQEITYTINIEQWNNGTSQYEWQPVAGGTVPLGTVTRSGNRLVIPQQDPQTAIESPGRTYQAVFTIRYRVFDADSPDYYIANTPYHKYVTIDADATSATEAGDTAYRAALTWQQGTDTGVFARDGATAYRVRYRSLFPDNMTDPNGTVLGEPFSPFYDPYTSELGNLVRLKWDTIAEGLYRVSIRNLDTGTVVAWLTNTGEDPLDPEQHWEYMPAAAEVERTWDGVDQLGEWNIQQSELYAQLAVNAFREGQEERIGAGFYAWNREIAAGQLGPQAYVWLKLDPDGEPIIGHGTYAVWGLFIESVTAETGRNTYQAQPVVLTHLPEPTKLELKVEDYNAGLPGWEAPYFNPAVAANTLEGYINNDKPVRIRFRVASRPGALWENNQSEVSIKLTREVHLRALIADQVVVYTGKAFEGSTHEDRAIYNRRFVNDEHTLRYEDAGYRKAKFLRWTDADPYGVTEWEFRPQDFKKDFRIGGLRESIRFGDYMQLEEVPQWSGARDVATARSRLNFALMSYLFYLSAFVTDRSGRNSWGINTSFVDKSKRLTNTEAATWAEDPMYMQRRTIVCRQWTREPNWQSGQRSAYSWPATSIADKLLEHWWWQHDITATTIGTVETNWSSYNLGQDTFSHNHRPAGSIASFKVPLLYSTSNRQLGVASGASITTYLGRIPASTSDVGDWNWESAPTWVPCITRDLHPYFFLPPMWVPPVTGSKQGAELDYRGTNTYLTTAGPAIEITYQDRSTARVGDAGASDTWGSAIQDMSESSTIHRFYPGQVVSKTEPPFKPNIPGTALNYVRQDETVHYEDLRGSFSRSKYPTAAPVKVASQGPYYINPFRYYGVNVTQTLLSPGYPLFHIVENSGQPTAGLRNEWFRTAFRSEYLWESGAFYPTDRNGQERLSAYLWWRTRFLTNSITTSLYYDFGAWTGWKDDLIGGTTFVCKQDGVDVNPFATGHMPVGISNVLPNTLELTTHLVVVPERRGDA